MNYSNHKNGQGLKITNLNNLNNLNNHESLKGFYRETTFNIIRASVANFMQVKKYFPIFAIFIMLAACSGKDNKDEIICSDEFRIVGVTVTGGELQDFYTVRSSTNDTIRYSDNQDYPMGRWYPVLDDSYQILLEGIEDDFYFVGILDGVKVINQHFIIGADRCHIYKLSGPREIIL